MSFWSAWKTEFSRIRAPLTTRKSSKKNAEKLFDFYYRPDVAAEVAAWVNYICPVEGAKDELLKIDPGVAKNPLIFPTEEMLANVKSFDPEAADNPDFKEKFQTVTGA